MPNDLVQELRTLADVADKATSGEWEYNNCGDGDISEGFQRVNGKLQADWIAQVDHMNAGDVDADGESEQRHCDGAAIVALHNNRAKLRESADRIEFLEKALGDAVGVASIRLDCDFVCCFGGKFGITSSHTVPELAAWLKEREGK